MLQVISNIYTLPEALIEHIDGKGGRTHGESSKGGHLPELPTRGEESVKG